MTTTETTGRIIGIRHRRKRTTKEEARPTQVAILVDGKIKRYDVEDETGELDFLLDRFPIEYRKVEDGEDLSPFRPHQVRWKKVKKAEVEAKTFPENLLRFDLFAKSWMLATHVPTTFDGLKRGDTVAMTLGGSGDPLAYAMTNRALKLGGMTKVLRVQPADLKRERSAADKNDDAELLTTLAQEKAELFYTTDQRDLDLIRVTDLWRQRIAVMKDRIACGQRILQQEIGRVFMNTAGEYPEGSVSLAIRKRQDNDKVFSAVEEEEVRVIRELTRAIERLDVYQQVFGQVEGVGPLLAARIIPEVRDIRRFAPEHPMAEIEALRAEGTRLQAEARVDEDAVKVTERIAEMDPKNAQYRYRRLQLIRDWKRANGKEAGAELIERALEGKKRIHALRTRARMQAIARFTKYCGVHVNPDGTFPRHRRGMGSDNRWSPEARQGFFLFVSDQCNKRPDSEWGQKLRANKVTLRQRCPVKVLVKEDLVESFRAMDRRLRQDKVFLQNDAFLDPSKCALQSRAELLLTMNVLEASDRVLRETLCDLGVPQSTLAAIADVRDNPEIATAVEALDRDTPIKGKLTTIYSDGHIHKMAIWRTATQFAQWLWTEWWKLEERIRLQIVPPSDASAEAKVDEEEIPTDETSESEASSQAA